MNRTRKLAAASMLALLASCSAPEVPEFYGTLEPFAEETVYFIVTDRFGVAYQGRKEEMDPWKEVYCQNTDARTLDDVIGDLPSDPLGGA